MRIKFDVPFATPNYQSVGKKKSFPPHWVPGFRPGNELAKKENLSEESNLKRRLGFLRAVATYGRMRRGVKVKLKPKSTLAKHHLKQRRRPRIKLALTVAKEAREIQEIARTHAVAAMERLATIINNPDSSEASAIAASQVIFDRAYGKAAQTNINASVDANGKPNQISGKELDERIATALTRVEELTGGKAKARKSKARPADLRLSDRDTGGTTKH